MTSAVFHDSDKGGGEGGGEGERSTATDTIERLIGVFTTNEFYIYRPRKVLCMRSLVLPLYEFFSAPICSLHISGLLWL